MAYSSVPGGTNCTSTIVASTTQTMQTAVTLAGTGALISAEHMALLATAKFAGAGTLTALPLGKLATATLAGIGTIGAPGDFTDLARGFGSTSGVGATDNIQTAYTTGLSGQKRSYSFWVFDDGTHGGSGLGRVFDKRTVSAQAEGFYNNGGNNYAYYTTWTSGIAEWQFNPPTQGVWHSIVVAYDSGSTANVPIIYVDGVSQSPTLDTGDSTAPSGSLVTNTDPYVIGNRNNDQARVWGGRITDFAIFDGILLTQANATSLASGVRANAIGANVNLVEYLPILGQSPEPDESGNGNNGIVTGTSIVAGPPALQPYQLGVLAQLAMAATASFAGTGALISTERMAMQATTTLAGFGTLTALPMGFLVTATLAGSSTLTATWATSSNTAWQATAVLAGIGMIVSAERMALLATTVLAGSGTLTALPMGTLITATLAGVGALIAPNDIARSFNGTSDKITTAINAGLTSASTFTLSAWAFATAAGTGVGSILSTFDDVSAFDGTALTWSSGGGNSKASLFIGGLALGIKSASSAQSLNSWYHLLVTYDGSGIAGVKIYINGNQVSTTDNATNPSSFTDRTWTIGANSFSAAGDFFTGWLEDLAVWNVVLTPTQITNLASGQRASTIGTNLVRNWPILGLSPEPDVSGAGANGTLTGTGIVAGPPALEIGPLANLGESAIAALAGIGALISTERMALRATAVLSGLGSLISAEHMGLIATATLPGAGTLFGLAQVLVFATAMLAGVGTLISAEHMALIASAALAGVGSLVSAENMALRTTTVLAGAGTLSVASTQMGLAAIATLAGSGTLFGSAQVLVFATALLSGVGALISAERMALQGTGTLAGIGAIIPAEHMALLATATFIGNGTFLAISGSAAWAATATLAGVGVLIPAEHMALLASAVIAGVGTLVSAEHMVLQVTANLVGNGFISASAQVLVFATATLAGIGTLISAEHMALRATATLIGAGALISAEHTALLASAVLAGSSTLAGLAQVLVFATATLIGTGVLFSVEHQTLAVLATFVGSGALISAERLGLQSTSVLAGSGVLISAENIALIASATFAGIGATFATLTLIGGVNPITFTFIPVTGGTGQNIVGRSNQYITRIIGG